MALAVRWLAHTDPDLFRDAFRRGASHLPTGVAIVAYLDHERRPSGLTVSSATCVSLAPPLVAVCIERTSPHADHIRDRRPFSVNLLKDDQAAVATTFGTHRLDKFQEVAWHFDEFRIPVLDDSLGVLSCECAQVVEAGDHRLILGDVRGLGVRSGRPLVYWRRSFQRLQLHYPFLDSAEALDAFVRQWESGDLPRASWSHAAHVAVAAYYAFDESPEGAVQRMKSSIVHFNACVGTVNDQDNGYHETLTRFWVETVSDCVQQGQSSSRLEAAREAVQRFGEDRDRHRLYYSFDVVRDRRARREWIRPDRVSRVSSDSAD